MSNCNKPISSHEVNLALCAAYIGRQRPLVSGLLAARIRPSKAMRPESLELNRIRDNAPIRILQIQYSFALLIYLPIPRSLERLRRELKT